MDPLSDVLPLLRTRSYVSSGFDAGGDWSIQFLPQGALKCYAVISGEAWLAVEGRPEPVRLRAGDCFVLPSGRPFQLASDLALRPIDSKDVFPPARIGGVVTHNGGGDFHLVGSRFTVHHTHASILLAMLPPIVHLHEEAEQDALRWAVERMRQELREQKPGGALVAQHLAHMMLIQALRLHQQQAGSSGKGWLVALSDKQLGLAIAAMHQDPARRWTLQTLAEEACMSRSAFASKFKDMVGTPALEYLTRWRMLLAADRLEHSAEPISAIAPALGYESESAFSTAFKRVMGRSPRRGPSAHVDEAVAQGAKG